jgi:hypothetical protein
MMPFDRFPQWLPAWQQTTGLSTWALAALSVLLLCLASGCVGWLRKRRRGRVILTALRASSRGTLEFRRGPGAWGFVAAVTPAPDPFREFSVSFRAMSILDPLDCLRRLTGAPPSRLHIWAILQRTPEAELVWARARIPERALGRGPGHMLWEIHRLDLGGAEYATRGLNAGALRHAFMDLYARFSAVLQRVIVQREGAPQFEVVVAGNALEAGEVSALLTSIRAIGRAAQIR